MSNATVLKQPTRAERQQLALSQARSMVFVLGDRYDLNSLQHGALVESIADCILRNELVFPLLERVCEGRVVSTFFVPRDSLAFHLF